MYRIAISGHWGLPDPTVRLVDQALRAALAEHAPDVTGLSCLAGWLLEALVGHALHVVSLIAWPALSNRMAAGARPVRPGSPGLYIPALAVTAYGTLTAGPAAIAVGFATSHQPPSPRRRPARPHGHRGGSQPVS